MSRYIVEYDENHCAWLVDLATQARTPLAHGTLLEVESLTSPQVPRQAGIAPDAPVAGWEASGHECYARWRTI